MIHVHVFNTPRRREEAGVEIWVCYYHLVVTNVGVILTCCSFLRNQVEIVVTLLVSIFDLNPLNGLVNHDYK